MSNALLVSMLAAAALLAGSCRATPEEVLERARLARDDKDMDALLACLTSRSAEVMRGLEQASARSRGEVRLLADPFSVIPAGEPESSEMDGDLAVLRVAQSAQRLVMLRERGDWRIDLLESGVLLGRTGAQ